MFRTETRAVATDAFARLKFRRYWALVSPGVALIRQTSLGPLKAEAERRARQPTGHGARSQATIPELAWKPLAQNGQPCGTTHQQRR